MCIINLYCIISIPWGVPLYCILSATCGIASEAPYGFGQNRVPSIKDTQNAAHARGDATPGGALNHVEFRTWFYGDDNVNREPGGFLQRQCHPPPQGLCGPPRALHYPIYAHHTFGMCDCPAKGYVYVTGWEQGSV